MNRILLSLIIILPLLAGCSKTASPESQTKSNVLYVTPEDLFAGKDQKFKPFLGPFAGAVKLHYEGDEGNLESVLEIWKNGKKANTLSTLTLNILDQKTHKGQFNGEFAVSIQENTNTQNHQFTVTSAFIDDSSGYTSSVNQIDAQKNYNTKGSIQLNEPIQSSNGEEIAVFGVQATDANSMTSYQSIEETIKKAKWAIVMRVQVSARK